MKRQMLSMLGASVLAMSVACDNQGTGTGTGGGGHSSANGSANQGSGGPSSTGGQTDKGGSQGSGGSSASSSSGGSSSTSSAGGSSAAGSGGSSTTGGTTGGTGSTGGANGKGGTASPGGTPGRGGTTAAGGTVGGTSAGGTSGAAGAAGGTTAKGTGGTNQPDAGTSSGAGGTPGTGGTTSTGTSQWPQCWGSDAVPTTALKQRAPSSDYTTQVAVGGVAMIIGPNRQSCLTDSVVNFDVKDLNQELMDVVETVKFYGFLDWTRGYYMNWVILNSGIPDATISGQGGHQGDRYGHMNFESSEECPCNWGTGDDSNRGSALHESIHALQAELWAFNNEASGWIHEAHNCYTATMRAHMVENKYTEGWGTALTLQMPHGPIESMGMNTDGSWAGPADQNAKT